MLQLQGCNFSGSLPPAWIAALPSGLERLGLWGNRLDGALPDGWSLRVLWLHTNAFTGSPSTWSFPSLTNCSLQNTHLSVPLPAALPSGLQELFLYNASFQGPIPAGWEQLPSNLALLSLAFNKLTGSIPPAWGSQLPASLVGLELHANSLTGSVPSFYTGVGLRELSLSRNRLAGRLPTALPPRLERLYLTSNAFTGSIPADWQLPQVRAPSRCVS